MVADTLSYLESTKPLQECETDPRNRQLRRRYSIAGAGLYSIENQVMESGSDYFERIRLGISSLSSVSSASASTEKSTIESTSETSQCIAPAVNVFDEPNSDKNTATGGIASDINQSYSNETIAAIQNNISQLSLNEKNKTAAAASESTSDKAVVLVGNFVGDTTSNEMNETEALMESFINQLSLTELNEINTSIDFIFLGENNGEESSFREIHQTVAAAPADKNVFIEASSTETDAIAEVKNDKTMTKEIHEMKNNIKFYSNFDPFRRNPQPFMRTKRSNSLFEFYRPNLSDIDAIAEENM